MNRSALFFRIRQFGAVLGGVWLSLWAARAVQWATGLDGALMTVLAAACAVAGVVFGVSWAREVEPSPAGERSAGARWGRVLAILLAGAAGFVAARLVG